MKTHGHTETTAPVCPCGGSSYKTILEAGRYCVYGWNVQPMDYQLRKCRRCGLIRTWPEPPHEEHHVFRDDTFLESYLQNPGLYEHYLRITVGEIARVKPAPGRFLDVGANIGTQLKIALDRGYDAVGVELNTAACDYARSQGLNVINAACEEAGFEDASFDVISLSATAEHIPDFGAELGLYRRLLKPGGLLHLSNSPNYRSLGARFEKDLWYGIQPTGHVWQFTPKTLKAVVRRCGLDPVYVRTYNLHRDFGRGKKERLRKRAFAVAEKLGLGDALSVGAVRPRS
ncbi:MAG TPA: class I SAM-dependent methyltransferase [Actinomycetota bacterium]